MADDKKTDGYAIEMDKLGQGNRAFEAPAPPPQTRGAPAALSNNPILPVLAYCGSSILMTVMNKYVLSGTNFNLNFFLLCVQVRVEEWKKKKGHGDFVTRRVTRGVRSLVVRISWGASRLTVICVVARHLVACLHLCDSRLQDGRSYPLP